MKLNMGTADRAVRTFIVAPVLIVLALFVFGAGSIAGVIALVVAAVMLLTSAVGNCPLYSVLGVLTCPRDEGSVSVSR
ncbi:MAG: DUF2892 domain-containing protein [Solirubrobacterales bacterium]